VGELIDLVSGIGMGEPSDKAKDILGRVYEFVILGQHALEAGVGLLDLGHRIVDQLADGRLLGVVLQMRPACFLGHPEHVLGQILVGVFGSGGVSASSI
jgi:hypothetical protein